MNYRLPFRCSKELTSLPQETTGTLTNSYYMLFRDRDTEIPNTINKYYMCKSAKAPPPVGSSTRLFKVPSHLCTPVSSISCRIEYKNGFIDLNHRFYRPWEVLILRHNCLL